MRRMALGARIKLLSLGSIASVIAAAAAPAHAQTLEAPRHRQGYYLALGIHGAVTHNWEDGRALGLWGGSASTLRIGQLLTRRFGLGLQIDFGGTARGHEKAGFGGLAVEAQWEILSNLSARAGVGLAVVQLSDDRDQDAPLRGTVGAGYFLGLGYDYFPGKSRLTGGFSLTPLCQVRIIPSDPVSAIVGVVGVELGWWTGLPRNQLELPPSEAFKR